MQSVKHSLKPFHSHIGAIGFLEREAPRARGVTVLINQANPRTLRIETLRVTFDRTALSEGPRYRGDQGWVAVEVQKVPVAPKPPVTLSDWGASTTLAWHRDSEGRLPQ